MSVDTPEQLEGLRRVGALVVEVIESVERAAAPGVTTGELDLVAARLVEQRGGRSGPIVTYDYPGCICLSVDDEVVHGIPGERVLLAGQLLTIDVALELDGYHADAARTIEIGGETAAGQRQIAAARAALRAGIRAARPGATLRDVGAAIERVASARGYPVVPELTGHGIGLAMHEPPTVFNVASPDPRAELELTRGLVFTIEPMVVAGSPEIVMRRDGWTIATADGSRAAHEEHTVMVDGDAGALVLTA